ncbi:MAG: helix-turn-helix domain-containing protein [Sporichthyaceae bacterium]
MDSSDTNASSVPRLLLTPEQAADALRLGRSRVYELMRDRRLRSVTVGRSRRIPYASLLDFVKQLEELAGAKPI